MVRIRLRRMGAKKKPFYRIVVADKRSPRDGRFIENIGTYNPLTNPETVEIKHDRAAYWLSVGAQPSDAVGRLLKKVTLIDDNGKPTPYDPERVIAVIEESKTAAQKQAAAAKAAAEKQAAEAQAAAAAKLEADAAAEAEAAAVAAAEAEAEAAKAEAEAAAKAEAAEAEAATDEAPAEEAPAEAEESE